MPLKALIIDDSALIRKILTSILDADPNIEVAATAPSAAIALQKIAKLQPDFVTLDIEMPELNGLELLEHLQNINPLPVIVLSGSTKSGSPMSKRAFQLGAIDVLAKPDASELGGWDTLAEKLLRSAKAAAPQAETASNVSDPVSTPTAPKPVQQEMRSELFVIGASTGGVPVIETIASALPINTPPIVVAQHMPPFFLARFARRLDAASQLRVAIAEDGEQLQPGRIYVASGQDHLMVHRRGNRYFCRLRSRAPDDVHCPGIDVLFESAAKAAGREAVGILLTGMGTDGACGLKAMRDSGAITIAQSAKTCVVYGMPKAAVMLGAVDAQMAPQDIAHYVRQNIAA